jgi:predicted DCC family thiol-disulfide oxidoreductase YuxK
MTHPVVFFDGVCNLCNASINFIIVRDTNDKFRFAPLQSEYAQRHFLKTSEKLLDIDSIILFENNRFYIKSTAALRIARHLGGFWQLFYAFIIIPPFIRNFIYDIIARNRYRWFGKREQCMIPDEKIRIKFLY